MKKIVIEFGNKYINENLLYFENKYRIIVLNLQNK